jgi:DNA-binding GntR family transcriptional regulator
VGAGGRRGGEVTAAIDSAAAFLGVRPAAPPHDELIRALERMMPQIRRLDVLHFTQLAREGAGRDHAELLAACRRRDAHTAAELVEANYLRLGEQIAAILDQED